MVNKQESETNQYPRHQNSRIFKIFLSAPHTNSPVPRTSYHLVSVSNTTLFILDNLYRITTYPKLPKAHTIRRLIFSYGSKVLLPSTNLARQLRSHTPNHAPSSSALSQTPVPFQYGRRQPRTAPSPPRWPLPLIRWTLQKASRLTYPSLHTYPPTKAHLLSA